MHIPRIQFAHCNLVRHRSPRCRLTHNAYTGAGQTGLEPLDTTLPPAGAHSEPCSVLYLIHRNKLPFTNHLHDLVKGYVVAMANIRGFLRFMLVWLKLNRSGIILFNDESPYANKVFTMNVNRPYTGNVCFVRFTEDLFNYTLAKLFTVVIDKETF